MRVRVSGGFCWINTHPLSTHARTQDKPARANNITPSRNNSKRDRQRRRPQFLRPLLGMPKSGDIKAAIRPLFAAVMKAISSHVSWVCSAGLTRGAAVWCLTYAMRPIPPQASLPTEEETKQMIIDACESLGIVFDFETKTIT